MEPQVSDAVAALQNAIATLLPQPPQPEFAREVRVRVDRSHLSGIGGYIGLSANPADDIRARRLQASVIVRVKANSVAELGQHELDVSNALVGADRIALRNQGIHRLTQASDETPFLDSDDGLAVNAGRDLTFKIQFEFQQAPQPGLGSIDSLNLDLVQQTVGRQSQRLFRSEFEEDISASFSVSDDAAANNGPGDWVYDGDENLVRQQSGVGGGGTGFSPQKHGSAFLLLAGESPALARDLVFRCQFRSAAGGIGLVYRYVDPQNYDLLLLHRPATHAMVIRNVGGTRRFLTQGGRRNDLSYTPNVWSDLRIATQGPEVEVFLDGAPLLSGVDDSSGDSGRIGFFSRNNTSAEFRFVDWIGLF